jgi:hypothetical protein
MKRIVKELSKPVLARLCAVALATIVGTATLQQAKADEADAERLLRAMSDYLAAQEAISFAFDTTLEVITTDLQKLALASSGMMVVNRPDKIWATRTGGFTDVELFFDGSMLTLFGKTANLYGQIAIPGTLDHLIRELRETHGKPLPGADLLESNVYDVLMSSAVDLKDLGSGVIRGVECDHLAARTSNDVDWQIWIAQGDSPYPCRYVVTSTLIAGAPEYSVDVRDWKAGDEVASTDFSFSNPTNAAASDLNDLTDMDDLSGFYSIGGPK